MIPDEFVEEVKYKNPIADVVSAYVQLRRRGRTSVGLCPFHSEKSPSFTVYEDSNSYYCFGCGAGGDVIGFIRQIENLSYIEAMKLLAARAGMAMPEDAGDDEGAKKRSRILEANRIAARFFYEQLLTPAGREAQAYLQQRGLSAKTIKQFGIGFAPDSWDMLRNHLKEKGYSYELMEEASLLTKGKNGSFYDKFRGRVMFPIFDLRGSVIGFGGRILKGDGAKYMNSGDTPVFKKSRHLFALNLAKNSKEKRLILCEGYMDVISLHQAGFGTAVATLGTALTAEQARLISQYAHEVVVCYDSDEAGQKAAKRASSIFSQLEIKVKILTIPGAKDPDEFIKKYGDVRFKLLLDGAQNATEYELGRILEKYDLSAADGRVGALKEAVKALAEIPSRVERDVYASKLAGELDASKDAILLAMEDERKRAYRAKQKREQQDYSVVGFDRRDTVNPQRSQNITAALAEEGIIALLLRNPDYIDLVEQQLTPEHFITDFNRQVYTLIRERLMNRMIVDIGVLSAELTPEQTGKVQRMLIESEALSQGKGQLLDYIKVLGDAENKVDEGEIGQMQADDLQRLFDDIRKKQGKR